MIKYALLILMINGCGVVVGPLTTWGQGVPILNNGKTLIRTASHVLPLLPLAFYFDPMPHVLWVDERGPDDEIELHVWPPVIGKPYDITYEKVTHGQTVWVKHYGIWLPAKIWLNKGQRKEQPVAIHRAFIQLYIPAIPGHSGSGVFTKPFGKYWGHITRGKTVLPFVPITFRVVVEPPRRVK